MPHARNVSILLAVAGFALLATAGYSLLAERPWRASPIEIGFTNPDSLLEMKSMSTNRLPLQIRNKASTPARIVGTDAC